MPSSQAARHTRNNRGPVHRQEVKRRIDRLSEERVQVALDFLAYLEERESNEATEELRRIPGFMEAFRKAKKDVAAGRVTDWRKVRRDV